jgi:hypothetical protein
MVNMQALAALWIAAPVLANKLKGRWLPASPGLKKQNMERGMRPSAIPNFDLPWYIMHFVVEVVVLWGGGIVLWGHFGKGTSVRFVHWCQDRPWDGTGSQGQWGDVWEVRGNWASQFDVTIGEMSLLHGSAFMKRAKVRTGLRVGDLGVNHLYVRFDFARAVVARPLVAAPEVPHGTLGVSVEAEVVSRPRG